MSKKNSLAKRRKQHQYQITLEKETEAEAQKRQVKRENSEVEQRKRLAKQAKRPKVEPVVSSDVKKAKKQKMALAKQLKGMSIGDKKSGIHNRKMSSSSESEGEEQMDIDQIGGTTATQSKGIKKSKPVMSRATYLELKKMQKRLVKSGVL